MGPPADQTIKVLGGLKAPVTVYVVDKPDGFQRFRDALGGYEYASTNVHVELWADDPVKAQASIEAVMAEMVRIDAMMSRTRNPAICPA